MTTQPESEITPQIPIETQPHFDWYLGEYVKFANKGLRFPITLYCSGLLVSGIIIGGEEYFEMAAEQVKQSFTNPEEQEVISNWVSGWKSIYTSEDDNESDEGDEADVPPLGFIHLMDAKIFHPGQIPIPSGKDGVLWRGRLSSINGFHWGALAVTK